MSPVSLCAEKHYKELRKGIARTFRDGMGEKRLRMGEKCWKWWELLRMGGTVCRERRKPSEGSDLKWSTSIILGEVTCCFSNGCNLSIEMARESLVSWLLFEQLPNMQRKMTLYKSHFFTHCRNISPIHWSSMRWKQLFRKRAVSLSWKRWNFHLLDKNHPSDIPKIIFFTFYVLRFTILDMMLSRYSTW